MFFSKASIFVLELVSCVLCVCVCVCSCDCYEFGSHYQCNHVPGETCLRNDVLCVEWDVEPYTLIIIIIINSMPLLERSCPNKCSPVRSVLCSTPCSV